MTDRNIFSGEFKSPLYYIAERDYLSLYYVTLSLWLFDLLKGQYYKIFDLWFFRKSHPYWPQYYTLIFKNLVSNLPRYSNFNSQGSSGCVNSAFEGTVVRYFRASSILPQNYSFLLSLHLSLPQSLLLSFSSSLSLPSLYPSPYPSSIPSSISPSLPSSTPSGLSSLVRIIFLKWVVSNVTFSKTLRVRGKPFKSLNFMQSQK